jgi:glycosyltransferase involved in cell wall biosynthesis
VKIIQLIQKPQARGVELFTCQLSEQLLEMGHEVILISIFEGSYSLPFSGKQIHLKRLIKKRFIDFGAWKEFSQLIKNEKPDIIQANAADTLKFSVFSKKLFGWNVPIIFRNASQVSLYIKNPWVRRFNGFLYRNVDAIISVSNKSKEDFNSVFHFRKPQEVIPIGINVPTYRFENELEENPVLVHIGGFTFEKNHSELIEIFSAIHKQLPYLKLWLIGEGPLKNEIEFKVQNMGLQNGVVFKGTLAEPFESILSNSILVLPSNIEGLPAVILEAFAHQIPVVAYGVGGIPEVVINKETGWCVDSGNSEAFKESILEVLNTPLIELEKITAVAKELVLKNYQMEQIAKEFEMFYGSVIARG